MKFAKRIFTAYQTFLHAHPVYTNAIQTGFLMGVGDTLCQTAVEGKKLKDLDKRRIIQFTGIGVVLGPALYLWYAQLVKIKGRNAIETTVKKIAADQLLGAPIVVTSILSGVSTLNGHTIEETKAKLKEDLIPVLITNYKIWPMVQFVNFFLVPLNYQVLLVQCVAIFWNTYISYVTHSDHQDKSYSLT